MTISQEELLENQLIGARGFADIQLFICAGENIPVDEPKEEEKGGWS